jgi:hypothetical protein
MIDRINIGQIYQQNEKEEILLTKCGLKLCECYKKVILR